MEGYQGAYQNGQDFRDSDFQRLAQNVGTNIQKILQNVSSMQRMIAQIGTPQDNQQLQMQLHQIQHYTGQLAKDTSKHLKDLNNVSSSNSSDQRQWRMQRERLQNDFTKALNSFQAAQRTAAEKEKEVIKKAKLAAGAGHAFGGPSSAGQNLIDMEEGTSSSAILTGQSKTQMLLEEETSMQQLHEREKAMRQLEADIVDVNTIFKDLASMVHEQGDLVDSIENNVETAHVQVSSGTEQLRQAEQYKISARKKKVLLGTIFVVILAIIIGIIAWQSN